MHFEAESNGKKFEVTVAETRKLWKIGIKEENKEWKTIDLDKNDYQSLDDTISFLYKNSSYLVDAVGSGTEYTVYTRGSHRSIHIQNDEMLLHESLKSGNSMGGGDDLAAGMPGKIVKIFVKPGEEVAKGGPLLIMEAMKMENELRATTDVVVKDILVEEGENVESGAQLVTFESS